MQHCAVSQQTNAVAADGSTVIVSFDYEARKKTALPEAVRRRIAEIEEREL
jgi:acyl-CoA thioesterase FadM